MQIRELVRRMENLLRTATVIEVDTDNARLKVRYADQTQSGWLPWFSQRAGDSITWHAPDIGERVMILSPSGEPTSAVVLTGLYSDERPAPSTEHDLHLIQYPNGDYYQHHRGTGDTHTQISGVHHVHYNENNGYYHDTQGNVHQKISGVHHIEYADGSFIQHDTSGNLTIHATGNIVINAAGEMVLKAAKIYEN
jgi:phage baseplate assembly protein gpV